MHRSDGKDGAPIYVEAKSRGIIRGSCVGIGFREPPNMAFPRTRRRSLRSLGVPLNAYPLGA